VQKILSEFKAFLMRGNLIELAIAFVMAVAFTALVTAFVDHLVNPLVGAIFGQPDFNSMSIDLWTDARLRYGAFLNETITFLGIAASVFFFIVKPYNHWKARHEVEEETPPPPPEDDETVVLLREIRDSLSRS
jgi:large conductance mechanosensitive channel